MALIKNKLRQHKVHDRHMNIAPGKGGAVIYAGAYVVREAATDFVIPGADLAGVVPLGVVGERMFSDDPDRDLLAHLDNTGLPDGVVTAIGSERAVRYDQAGEWLFAVAGAAVPRVGDPAYLVDDDTVSAENGAGLAAVNGVIAGHFTRPGPGGWFIDISRRGF